MIEEPDDRFPNDADRFVRIAEPRLPFLRVPSDWYRRVGSSRTVSRVITEVGKNSQGKVIGKTIAPVEFKETVSRRVLDIAKVNAAAAEIGNLNTFERAMRAMMLVEAHVLDNLPPSTAVLDALAIAWAISGTVAAEEAVTDDESDHSGRHQRRVRARLQDWPDVAAATDAAAALTSRPMTRARRVALHRIVRWFMRCGLQMTWPVREAIAKATGLLDRDGTWRDEVIFAQQRMVDPKIIADATLRDRRLLDQTVLPKVRNRAAFDKAVSIAADALLASEFAKKPDMLVAAIRADWYRDRENFMRSKPPAKEVAKVVGVREATIRDWRNRSDWPDRVLLCAIAQKVWPGQRSR